MRTQHQVESQIYKLRNEGIDIALERRSGSRFSYRITDRTGSINYSEWMSILEVKAFLDGFEKSIELWKYRQIGVMI